MSFSSLLQHLEHCPAHSQETGQLLAQIFYGAFSASTHDSTSRNVLLSASLLFTSCRVGQGGGTGGQGS